MQNPTYLIRSEHAVFHFRWPLPLQMMQDGKRRYVKVSLNTREPKEALYLSKFLSYHAHTITMQAWATGMEYRQIRAIVQEYVQEALASAKQRILKKGLFPPQTIADFRGYIHNPEFSENEGLFEDNITRMLQKAHVDVAVDSDDYQQFRKTYYAAAPAMYAEIIRFNEEQSQFDFNPAHQPSEALPRLAKPRHTGTDTLAKVVDRFVAAHVNDKAWHENTKNDKQAKLAMLIEVLGKEFIVADMDLEKAREIRDLIKQLPKNLNKNPKVRGKPLTEAMAVTGVEKLSAITVQKYLDAYSMFYKWCASEGIVNDNPFTKIKASVDKKKKDKVVREPFTSDQIKKIQAAIEDEKTHYRYWGTLIGMYTGARLNEVAQIMLDDIKQKDGIWYFHMNDDEENKRLKTPAARRQVPIHKKLLDLGIIAEMERLRKEGHKRFLHELTYCPKNGYGKKLGQFFNQVLLPDLNMKRKELVFHSLRHTANTCLYQAGVPDAIVHTIIGHERSGTSQQVYFKQGYTIQQLKEAMDKFDPVKIVINSD